MELEAENSKLKPIFRILYDNISKGFIQVTEEKMIIESADPANTMMFSIEADADFFDSFEPEINDHQSYHEENHEGLMIGCFVDGFYPILKKFSSSDDISIKLENNEIKIASDSHVISRKTLNLDINEQVQDVEGIELDSNFSVNAEQFIDAIDKLSVFENNTVKFDVQENQMILNLEADKGSAYSVIDLEEWNEQVVQSLFGISLLKDLKMAIQRLHSADDKLKMRMDDNHPLETILNQKNLKLSIFLAPRIEEK